MALRCGLADAAVTLRLDEDLAALRGEQSFEELLMQVEAATARLGSAGLSALGANGLDLGFLAQLKSSPERWFANRAKIKAEQKAERIARQKTKAASEASSKVGKFCGRCAAKVASHHAEARRCFDERNRCLEQYSEALSANDNSQANAVAKEAETWGEQAKAANQSAATIKATCNCDSGLEEEDLLPDFESLSPPPEQDDEETDAPAALSGKRDTKEVQGETGEESGADADVEEEEEDALAGEGALRGSSGFAALLAKEAAADPLIEPHDGLGQFVSGAHRAPTRRRRRKQRPKTTEVTFATDRAVDAEGDAGRMQPGEDSSRTAAQSMLVQRYRSRPASASATMRLSNSSPGAHSGIVQRYHAKKQHADQQQLQSPHKVQRPSSAAALLEQFVDAENEAAFDLMHSALTSPGGGRGKGVSAVRMDDGGARRLFSDDDEDDDNNQDKRKSERGTPNPGDIDAVQLGMLLAFWKKDEVRLLPLFRMLPVALRPALARQTLRQVAVGLEVSPRVADYACELAGLPPSTAPPLEVSDGNSKEPASVMEDYGTEEGCVDRDEFVGRLNGLAHAWAVQLAVHAGDDNPANTTAGAENLARTGGDNELAPPAAVAQAAMAAVTAGGEPAQLWLSAVLGGAVSSPTRSVGSARRRTAAATASTPLSAWERRCHGAITALGLSPTKHVAAWTVEQLSDWFVVMDLGLRHAGGAAGCHPPPCEESGVLHELLWLPPDDARQQLGLEWAPSSRESAAVSRCGAGHASEVQPSLRQRKLLVKALDFLRVMATQQQRAQLQR